MKNVINTPTVHCLPLIRSKNKKLASRTSQITIGAALIEASGRALHKMYVTYRPVFASSRLACGMSHYCTESSHHQPHVRM